MFFAVLITDLRCECVAQRYQSFLGEGLFPGPGVVEARLLLRTASH